MSFKCFVGSNGTIPSRGDPEAAGWDLYSAENVSILQGEQKLVKTDLTISISKGWYGRIAPRSGLAFKHGIDIAAGVIDSSYRGEIGVIVVNTGFVNLPSSTFEIKKSDRIAQLIITKYNDEELIVVQSKEQLGETNRGTGGFGSTGV